MVQELTTADFKDVVGKGNVVVDFWAPWCGPCKMFGPIFEDVANEKKDVTFAKLNTENEETVAGEYGIRSIPTLLFFKDGKEVAREVGGKDKDAFLALIEEHFG